MTRGTLSTTIFHHECAHILYNDLKKNGSNFEKRWLATNREGYGFHLIKGKDSTGKNFYVWDDYYRAEELTPEQFFREMNEAVEKYRKLEKEGKKLPVYVYDGARYGFASAYGCQNCLEDVAEFVSLFRSDPESFRSVIDPSDPNYNAAYSDIYVAKLKLLIEYGFIGIEEVPAWMVDRLYN